MDDDTLLQDLVVASEEDNHYTEDVETSPKRGGEHSGGDESPAKSARVEPRKMARRDEPGGQSSSPSPTTGDGEGALPAGDPQVRMVVGGELLEDGDVDMEFPDRLPELTIEEMWGVEAKAAELEVTRLVEMGVLVPPADGLDMTQVDGDGLEET
eukprot:s1727_g12.t1